MKRFSLFLALLVGVGMGSLQAQKCSKSAEASCHGKSAQVSATQNDGSADAAAKLASLDESIETRTCEKSGKVSYVRKVVDDQTGTVSFSDVQYDSELGKFVNVSPTMKSAGCCSKMKSASGCCAGKGGVKSADSGTKETEGATNTSSGKKS